MSTTDPRRAMLIVVACLCVVAAACSPGEGASGDGGEANAGACEPSADETPAKALLRCGARSVVFVETPYGSGSGIVVDAGPERYVLTNLHVVDPFDEAAVTLASGDPLAVLPVLGAEAATDIALLGPVADDDTAELDPVPLAPNPVDKGDDVFVVGYPGTASTDEVDLTITSGLVSRRRDLPEWDQTYVQTDAVVEEGQSGGPMFGADGALVGITALGLDESFSLALETEDVARSAKRIVEGDGDPLPLVPATADGAEGGATSGTIEMPDDLESPTLFLPASDGDRTWNLSVTGPTDRYGVTVVDAITGDVLAANAAGVTLDEELVALEASLAGVGVEEYAGPSEPVDPEVVARETSPGTFHIEVQAEVAAEVTLFVAPDAVPATLGWSSDLELWPLTEPVPVQPLDVDEQVQTVLGAYQYAAGYDVELTEGDEVRLLASSPQGYVDVVVAEPGATITGPILNAGVDTDGITFFAESGGGLYDTDVDEQFTAPATGTYRVLVENLDMYTIAARLEVRSDG